MRQTYLYIKKCYRAHTGRKIYVCYCLLSYNSIDLQDGGHKNSMQRKQKLISSNINAINNYESKIHYVTAPTTTIFITIIYTL